MAREQQGQASRGEDRTAPGEAGDGGERWAPSACGLLSEQEELVSKLKLWSWVPGLLCSFNQLSYNFYF